MAPSESPISSSTARLPETTLRISTQHQLSTSPTGLPPPKLPRLLMPLALALLALAGIPHAYSISCYNTDQLFIQSCDPDGSKCKNAWQVRLFEIPDNRTSENITDYTSCIAYSLNGHIVEVGSDGNISGYFYKQNGSPGPVVDGRGTFYNCTELVSADGLPTELGMLQIRDNYEGLTEETIYGMECCDFEFCNDQLGASTVVLNTLLLVAAACLSLCLMAGPIF